MESILAAAAAERLRYFDFFPDSVSTEANYLYSLLVFSYFRHFPALLSYDDYREQAFQTAYSAAAKLAGNTDNTRLRDKVDAWRLIRVKLSLGDAAGNPRQGTVKITNVTADSRPELFPADPYYEERTVAVNGEVEIPVYAGHVYEITATIPMPGGNDLILPLPQFPQTSGQKVVYGSGSDPVYSTLPDGVDAEAEIVMADAAFPYNLSFERNIDVFNLSWDWVDSEAFQAVAFKVFNGTTLVADVTDESIRGAAYGLRQSLDAAGAFVGPLIATLLLLLWTEDLRSIFWIALIPGAACLLLILIGVEDNVTETKKHEAD